MNTQTTSRVYDFPACAYVPSNKGPHPFGDVSSFRKALCPAEGYYFAARVESDFDTPASEAIPWPSMVPGYAPSDLLVFRWDAEPHDGDVVFVKVVRRQRAESRITRLFEWLYSRSLRTERLCERIGWRPRYEPTDREYLVRRFWSEGTPDLTDGTGFRLETLDGVGEVIRHTELVDLFVSGVLTEHKPWGEHRDLVTC